MNIDASFWDFVLRYHESEPIIANICVLLVVFTPLITAFLVYLHKKEALQVKQFENVMKYKKKDGSKKNE